MKTRLPFRKSKITFLPIQRHYSSVGGRTCAQRLTQIARTQGMVLAPNGLGQGRNNAGNCGHFADLSRVPQSMLIVVRAAQTNDLRLNPLSLEPKKREAAIESCAAHRGRQRGTHVRAHK
jgi:hypothetical protein